MTKNDIFECKLFLFLRRWVYNLIVGTLISVFIFLAILAAFYSLREPARNLLMFLPLDIIEWPWVTGIVYSWVSIILSLALAVTAIIILFKKRVLFKRYTVRNFKYLQETIQSSSDRAPASSIDDLVKKITKTDDTDARKVIKAAISSDLTKVSSLLARPLEESNVNIICGGWGVGKTTMTMLGLETIEANNRRYIYEVAFHYVGELDKLKNAILKNLRETIGELGMSTGLEIDAILFNLQKDYIKSLSSIFHSSRAFPITSDSIRALNSRYQKESKKFEIDITIDDIDRLPEKSILEVIAFLAILSQLRFVRVIIPVDISAVNAQISSIFRYKSETFLAKYFPKQTSVEIKSKYQLARDVAFEKLRMVCGHSRSLDYYPAWAAILFKLISDKVDNKAENWSTDFRWNAAYAGRRPEEYSDKLTQLLNARYRVEYRKLSPAPLYLRDISDGRKFISYITSTTTNDGTKIKNIFGDEYYEACASWVFDFALHCWDILDISIRDVVDELSKLEGIELSMDDNVATQFAKIFNKLLREDVIKPIK